MQGSEKGKQHNYYFNEGAMLDASNGGDRAAVLAHNWGGFDTNTAENFYIGEGKEFVVKSYSHGRGTLIAEEGATLSVTGGNVILESGIESTANMDNTASSIHMESSGVLKIDAESMWMGNKRTEDRHNVGAISMAGDSNLVDIYVEKTFTAKQVDMGIALQTKGNGSMATADIRAGGDITISAQRSDGGSASGYRGAGIYSLAYHAQDSESRTSLISDNGNIAIDAQGYGVYACGNTPTTLKAQMAIFPFIAKRSMVYIRMGTLIPIKYCRVICSKYQSSVGCKDSRGVQVTDNGNVTAAASQITFLVVNMAYLAVTAVM